MASGRCLWYRAVAPATQIYLWFEWVCFDPDDSNDRSSLGEWRTGHRIYIADNWLQAFERSKANGEAQIILGGPNENYAL
jgi:hypothetical protein